jgi:hypothetical protein
MRKYLSPNLWVTLLAAPFGARAFLPRSSLCEGATLKRKGTALFVSDKQPTLCRSAKVETIVADMEEAAAAVKELEEAQKARLPEFEKEFSKKMKAHLDAARITKHRVLQGKSYIKTDFSAEFSVAAVAKAIEKALEAAAATAASAELPIILPEAIGAYADLVTSVAECAKSSSRAATELSFDMVHMGTGVVGFLYAVSTSLERNNWFGNQAVTSTVIINQIIYSEDAGDNFERIAILRQNIRRWRRAQSTLIEQYIQGTISEEEYEKKDAFYTKHRTQLEKELEALGDKKVVSLVGTKLPVTTWQARFGVAASTTTYYGAAGDELSYGAAGDELLYGAAGDEGTGTSEDERIVRSAMKGLKKGVNMAIVEKVHGAAGDELLYGAAGDKGTGTSEDEIIVRSALKGLANKKGVNMAIVETVRKRLDEGFYS